MVSAIIHSQLTWQSLVLESTPATAFYSTLAQTFRITTCFQDSPSMNDQVICTRTIEEENFAKIYAEQANTFPWSLFQNTPSQKDEENHKSTRRSRTSVPQTVRRHRQLRRNARERERQGRLNSAFDVLRGVIPDYLSGKGPERKLTQIETLRLATHYIMALSEMLEEENQKPAAEYCECGLAFSSSRPTGQEN